MLASISKFQRNVLLAARSLWLHKLRSALSVLGIIIGNVAVITLMAVGEGSKQQALEQIRAQGATNIIIRSVKPPDAQPTGQRTFIVDYGIKPRDYEQFLTIPGVSQAVRMRIAAPYEIRRQDKMFSGSIIGTTPEYAEINKLRLANGRFLTHQDDHYMENVCVLGASVADYHFPFEDPIGQALNINSQFYRVIGVCESRMSSAGPGGSQAAEKYDDYVFIPLNTFNVRFGEAVVIRQSGAISGEKVALHQVTLKVDTSIDSSAGREKVRAVGDLVREILETNHTKKDYDVTVPLDRLEDAEKTQDSYTRQMGIIASISLLVGGIGIMNIMLATVTERTREIGIRRALGAKRRDIIQQFLIEATVQTLVGGMIGVIIGVVATFAVPPIWGLFSNESLAMVLMLWPIALALVVSMGVGMGFGAYPAWRAARLDPIEALRHV